MYTGSRNCLQPCRQLYISGCKTGEREWGRHHISLEAYYLPDGTPGGSKRRGRTWKHGHRGGVVRWVLASRALKGHAFQHARRILHEAGFCQSQYAACFPARPDTRSAPLQHVMHDNCVHPDASAKARLGCRTNRKTRQKAVVALLFRLGSKQCIWPFLFCELSSSSRCSSRSSRCFQPVQDGIYNS